MSFSTLAAKILGRRHNNMLGEVDQATTDVHRAILIGLGFGPQDHLSKS